MRSGSMSHFVSRQLYPAFAVLLALTILVGMAYPAVVTIVAQVAFPSQANGSFITTTDGRAIGSSLIGQAFSQDQYFWSRPSAAGDGYDGNASSASNLAPTSQALLDRVAAEVDRLRAIHGDGPIPVDLVTTSASGLDPHISPAAAEYQVARIAVARGLTVQEVTELVGRHTAQPFLGFLGEPAVNVLLLNLDLDGLLAD
ncbi:MAG: potassium-transporting ATPase subunit KdpC [Candidatus Limnocylindrales bacterium]